MRRIIRSLKSRQYFRNGRWTPDPSLANHFSDTGEVIQTCMKYHLRNVELILQFSDEGPAGYDLGLRLFDYAHNQWA